MWRVFNRSGLFTGKVHAYVQTNTEIEPDRTGFIRDFEALVRREMISREEYDRFLQDIQSLAERGEYFHALTMYAYVGTKI